MPEPRVITFEKDIEEEIRSKAASLSDIASASGFVANKPVEKSTKPTVFLLLSLIMLFILAGIGGAFYYLYTSKNTGSATLQVNQKLPLNKDQTKTPSQATSTEKENKTLATSTQKTVDAPLPLKAIDREISATKRLAKTPFAELFPLTAPFVESQVTKVETVSNSYILTFVGYSEMFKKINDHEDSFHEDIFSLFSSATTSVFNQNSSTSTLFRDVRIGAVDAREMTLSSSTQKAYYSFIKPNSLIISEDKKVLEQIASDILK